MATLIEHNGTEREVNPVDTEHGFYLRELYELIGHGCDIIEVVNLADGRIMIIDEEGKLRDPMAPVNLKGTALLHEAGGFPDDAIIGNAVICSTEELK